MNFQEARTLIDRIFKEREEFNRNQAFADVDLQTKHVDAIGTSAYFALFGGIKGGPGPIGSGGPELEKRKNIAAQAILSDSNLEAIPSFVAYDYLTRKFKNVGDVGIECSSNAFFIKWFPRRDEFPRWDDNMEYNSRLLIGHEGALGS